MPEPNINFNQFTSMVNAKLNKMNMSTAGKTQIQGQLNSIFKCGDVNQDGMLNKTELSDVLGLLNYTINDAANYGSTVETKPTEQKQKINNPRFQGLEDYQFEQHGAKEGVGAITVNGEKMLISTDGSTYSLHRYDKGKFIDKSYDYSSMDELKKALTDKNNNFGLYSGIEDINDFFIP